MNRALLFIVAPLVVAFILVQVEGMYGYGQFAPPAQAFKGRGANTGAARAVNDYYQNYYKRYNALQTVRVLRQTIFGLRNSALLSLASLFLLALYATNSTGRLSG